MLYFLMQNTFKYKTECTQKEHIKEFEEWFDKTSLKNELNKNNNNNITDKLKYILRPFILKCSNLDIIKQLPHTKEIDVICNLSNS